MSAAKPGKVFWAEAKYFPSGEIFIAKLNNNKYMRLNYHGHVGMSDYGIECV
jgi:hypothetical protein